MGLDSVELKAPSTCDCPEKLLSMFSIVSSDSVFFYHFDLLDGSVQPE